MKTIKIKVRTCEPDQSMREHRSSVLAVHLYAIIFWNGPNNESKSLMYQTKNLQLTKKVLTSVSMESLTLWSNGNHCIFEVTCLSSTSHG